MGDVEWRGLQLAKALVFAEEAIQLARQCGDGSAAERWKVAVRAMERRARRVANGKDEAAPSP